MGLLFGHPTFKVRLNSIHNSSSRTVPSIRGYTIQRNTPIWTSRSRILSGVGKLTRSHSFRNKCRLHRRLLRLHLRRQLRLRHKLHPRLQLHLNLHLHPQLHRAPEPNGSQRPACRRQAATATSARANRHKSETTFPSFRGAPTIRPAKEMSGPLSSLRVFPPSAPSV